MGERLGRYMVLKHLASGGMADVLLARTDGIEGFERHVVLKRIRSEHAKDQRFIQMFLDEARLAANLHHQNIVQVHDIGESAGEYFFAMEYLHGEDLRAMLSVVSKTRAHMPLGTVVSIISSVAAGLHYAHARKIVHRDVSPSNILVSYDGSVKIVDFGIAKAAMRQVETRSGSLKGKVSYMSPEQCKMGTVDRRSDVYALGVVLYELVTTTRLFKSDSDYLVMDAICTGKIPLPRVRRPDLPNELSTIIMTALATDPERRYQTADELRSALDAFATKAGLTASASTIGAYVQKLCGEKPEPWLDPTAVDAKPTAQADASAGTDMTRKSWSEMPRAEVTEAKTVTDSKSKRRASSAPVVAAPAVAEPATPPTRTSSKLGWEKSLPTAPGGGLRPAKIAMIVVPLVAIAGLLVWKLSASSETKEPAAAANVPVDVTPVAPGPEKTAAPTLPSAPTPVEPAIATPAGPKPTAAKIATPATTTTTAKPAEPKVAAKTTMPPSTATVVKPTTPATTAATANAKPATPTTPAPVTTTTTPAPATPAPATAANTTTTPAPTATVAKPVEPTPTPAPTTIPALAPGVVEALASRNRKALLACEGTETLSGEITIRFQVDADGRVSQSALHTTVRKPAVSGCVLNVVKSWRFPKPASGAATGVYTISFQ